MEVEMGIRIGISFLVGLALGIIITCSTISVTIKDQPMDVEASDVKIIREARDSIEANDYKAASYFVKAIYKSQNDYEIVFDGECDEWSVSLLWFLTYSEGGPCMDPLINIKVK